MRLPFYQQFGQGCLRLMNNTEINNQCCSRNNIMKFGSCLQGGRRQICCSAVAMQQAHKRASGVNKQLLLELRRRTGYSFLNCRKAVEEHGDDVEAAVAWLNDLAVEQGWEKATKTKDRTAKQGLIGVLVRGQTGALVELNCETDFVARSSQFRSLVGLVAECCVDFVLAGEDLEEDNEGVWQEWLLDPESVSSVGNARVGSSIGDILSYNLGRLGERLTIRRAVGIKADDLAHLHGYAHPRGILCEESGAFLGRYGTLLALSHRESAKDKQLALDQLGNQLCQHVIGMHPSSIGVYRERTEEEVTARLDEENTREVEEEESGHDERPPQIKTHTTQEDSSELLNQNFIFLPSVTVGEVVAASGIHVLGFVRYELGETRKSNVDNSVCG